MVKVVTNQGLIDKVEVNKVVTNKVEDIIKGRDHQLIEQVDMVQLTTGRLIKGSVVDIIIMEPIIKMRVVIDQHTITELKEIEVVPEQEEVMTGRTSTNRY